MTDTDFLRSSRDGDQFHYTWAARQSLRLLNEESDLVAIYVEAVDTSESPAGETPTGDEVIDLTEYWGSTDIKLASRIVYRQFKHSTQSPDKPWTMSYLTKTLVGFARKYQSLSHLHEDALKCVTFEFISNRPAATSVIDTLRQLQLNEDSPRVRAVHGRLSSSLTPVEVRELCSRLTVDERAPNLLRLRHMFETQVADLLPGAPAEQALLLREMISSRATTIGGAQPAVRRADVLAALKTSDDQLLPAPNLIETPERPIVRKQFGEIAQAIQGLNGVPLVVHGPGGIGKSVLALALQNAARPGSLTLTYDCFANGSYRRLSSQRHLPKQGLVQLVNELAGHALCEPVIPSATADDTDYAKMFLCRLQAAAETLDATTPGSLLTLVIDAADNAAMIADDNGEQTFVRTLVRESLPSNCRLVLTCRTERIDRLGLPPSCQRVLLEGFNLDETQEILAAAFPGVATPDTREFLVRTSRNPRVQAAVLAATSSMNDALTWLGPNPASPDQALDALIKRQVDEIRDGHHGSAAEIDQICIGLAALRPMIPVRVLASLAEVHESVIHSFVADLGRPLLVDGGTVQFRDEPTETWFRSQYRPTGTSLDSFLARLVPLADLDAYVAASLPSLLYSAGRFNELTQLALSDDSLPDSTLPVDQRNKVQRLEIAQQRAHFALIAALRRDDDSAAAQLALRLGALNAGRTRRLGLIRENTDLVPRFIDSHVVEHLVAVRGVSNDWPNSNLIYEASMLSGADGQTEQARNRLRSGSTWITAWTQQAALTKADSGVTDQDVLQLAWGLLLIEGTKASVKFLLRWQPKELAFDVGVLVLRRLADAGRVADIATFARHSRGRHLKFAVAQVCAERGLTVSSSTLRHLLRPVLKRTEAWAPTKKSDQVHASRAEYVHEGLTAVNWLLTEALAHDLIDDTTALSVIGRYLPENLGHHTGDWYDRHIWEPILGQALKARSAGHPLNAEDIEGPRITKARARRKFESTQDLRAYEANVEPLVAWASLWLELRIHPSPADLTDFAQAASKFLQRKSHTRADVDVGHVQLNIIALLIVRVGVDHPDAVDLEDLRAFWQENRPRLWRGTRIGLAREAARVVRFHTFAMDVTEACYTKMIHAREDAKEVANDLVELSRAVLSFSEPDASAYFQAALDISDAIGDDAWARWEVLLKVAQLAADSTDQRGRAYRLGQIAEGLDPYLGDGQDHLNTLDAAVGLSLPEGVALGSRWRDRRFAPIGRLVAALATSVRSPLHAAPLSILALLPLNDSYINDHQFAEALDIPRNHAIEPICALLSLRRAKPFDAEILNKILTDAGVTRDDILAADSSLVHAFTEQSGDASGPYSEQDHSEEPIQFEDLDFTTPQGWADGLQRANGKNRDHLFAHIFAGGHVRPEVISAFAQNPTVDPWDLKALVVSLQGLHLSLAARLAADSAFVAVLPRLAAEYLLVSWRLADIEAIRSITQQSTDYAHAMSRGLVTLPAFDARQAFALAGNLTARLTVEQAQDVFDAATGLFAKVAPLDSADGGWPGGMTADTSPSEALAAMIWTALGDAAAATRWRASHAVHLIFRLQQSALAKDLLAVATGQVDVTPFLDPRLDFYDRHALQWLLIGLSRASVDKPSLQLVFEFAPLLRRVMADAPHAVNVPLARDILLRLHDAGLVDSDEAEALSKAGHPIGVVKHDWQARHRTVRTIDELLTDKDPPKLDDNHSDDDEQARDGGFRFFYDFGPYWCRWVSDAFGISQRSVERLVEEVLIDTWGVASRGQPEDDKRYVHELYPQSTYARKSDWPQEDDLDFYLSVHALYEVAGLLLERLPVHSQDDNELGQNEYTDHLGTHMPSRSDGRWLADRRDAPPPYLDYQSLDSGMHRSSIADNEWKFDIGDDMLRREFLRSDGRAAVSVTRQVMGYSRTENVQINSALVSPVTAPALLRALQTAPDKHAYRIPDTSDEEFSSTLEGFELTGWVDSSMDPTGRDLQDPLAGDIGFPPNRPAPFFAELSHDPDMRAWRDPSGRLAMKSLVWAEWEPGPSARGTSGQELLADIDWLCEQLERLDRWLLVEVEMHRTLTSTSVLETHHEHEGDDYPRYVAPHTKYFLLDGKGTVHEF